MFGQFVINWDILNVQVTTVRVTRAMSLTVQERSLTSLSVAPPVFAPDLTVRAFRHGIIDCSDDTILYLDLFLVYCCIFMLLWTCGRHA